MNRGNLDPEPQVDDPLFDYSLRPKRLGEFIGQEQIKSNLSVFLLAAKQRQEPLDAACDCRRALG